MDKTEVKVFSIFVSVLCICGGWILVLSSTSLETTIAVNLLSGCALITIAAIMFGISLK